MMQGVKVFWQWLRQIEKEEFAQFRNGIEPYLFGKEADSNQEMAAFSG